MRSAWARRAPLTALPGSFSRRDVVECYAKQSGRDISNTVFYYAYGLLKIAVIVQQIYFRYKRGQTQDERFAIFGSRIRSVIMYAAKLAQGG